MRTTILPCLLWLCIVTAWAKSDLDSLRSLLKNLPPGPDKLAVYSKVCWGYMGQNKLDSATYYADSVLLIAQQLNHETGYFRANYYYGVIARLRGDYTRALDHINKYLHYYVEQGDSSRVAGALFQIGVIYSSYGDYEKSQAAYYRGLAIEEADSNYYSVGYTLHSIGIVLSETDAYDDAIAAYKKALAIFDSLNELSDKTNVLVSLGNAYSAQHNFDVAKQYYKEALKIDREIGREQGIALSLANLAYLFDKMELYDSALYYHHQALSLRERLPNQEGLCRSLIGVAHGYINLKKYEDAKPYLIRAIELARQLSSKPLQRDVHFNFANLYEQTGRAALALTHYKRYVSIKDSIFNDDTASKINELEIKYEVGQKDKQIELLDKENLLREKESQRQAALKNTFIVALIMTALIGLVLIYSFRQRLKNQRLLSAKNEEIKEINFKRQLSELEMKALRAQINPHFLFNCINSINRMVLNGDKENASLYLKRFAKMVRLIVENAETTSVSLENELTLIESYIQLEELRFSGKISYSIQVDQTIDKENTTLPPMVLQPFVENAIWHGLMHKEKSEPGHISIVIHENHDTLICTIEDNGVGRERSSELKESSLVKTKSMGMKITEERLKLLGKEEIKELIRIEDLKNSQDVAVGTRVEISIPIT